MTLAFRHRWVPGSAAGPGTTLLMLHGTGGNEDDLVPLGEALLPGAPLLSPRGQVLEQGMPRFFRRLAEGVFDAEDLIRRTHELADFIAAAAAEYGFVPTRVAAVGFSNGANIAASLLMLRPEALSAAVLLRAMVPLRLDRMPQLAGRRVLISEGRYDPIVPRAQGEELATMLRDAGADVTLEWREAGHNLVQDDVDASRRWLASLDA